MERSPGNIRITREHSNPVTANGLIELRLDASKSCLAMADIYCAEPGGEQEANAKFIVRAWNSHDVLLAALEAVVKWQGVRDSDDNLLDADKQAPEICAAMKAIAKSKGAAP
jgi:hypothetical protein